MSCLCARWIRYFQLEFRRPRKISWDYVPGNDRPVVTVVGIFDIPEAIRQIASVAIAGRRTDQSLRVMLTM